MIGISIDSLFTQDNIKKEEQINFPLLSDYTKTTANDYGVLYNFFPAFEMQGVSKRAAFVIEKDAVIKCAEAGARPRDLPNF